MSKTTEQTGEQRVRFRDIADAYGFLVALLDEARATAAEEERELTEADEVGLLEAALAGVEGQLEDKVAGVVALVRRYEKRVKDRQAETAENHDLNRGDNSVVERLKRTLAWWLPAVGATNVRTALGTVIVQKERAKLGEVDDEAAFLSGYGFAVVNADVDVYAAQVNENPDQRLAVERVVAALLRAGLDFGVCFAVTVDDPAVLQLLLGELAAIPGLGSTGASYQTSNEGEARLLEQAANDREAHADWREALGKLQAGDAWPEEPVPTLPAFAPVTWERTVQIRTK